MLQVNEQPTLEMNQKPIDMETRIENELNGREPSSINELNLERCKATLIKGLNDEFKNLEMLNMSNIGLISLKGFPKLPNLRQLDLSDNSIANGLDNLLGCPNLTHLKLTGNKFKCLEDFAPLCELKNLTHLGLINTEMTPMEDYRDQVFKMMPNLKYVDGFDRNEREENGSDYDDSEEDDDDENDESEESEGGEAEQSEVGLSYLQKSNLDEEDEQDADFDVNKAKKKMKNSRRNEQDDDEDDDEEEEEGGEQKEGAENGNNNEANGNNENEEDEENDMSCEDGEKSEPGLSYLQKSNLDEESDDEDFDIEKEMEIEKEKNGCVEGEDDDDDDEDEELEEELSEDEKIVIKENEKEINQDGLKRKLKSESSKQI